MISAASVGAEVDAHADDRGGADADEVSVPVDGESNAPRPAPPTAD
jgi:hypothetical protein